MQNLKEKIKSEVKWWRYAWNKPIFFNIPLKWMLLLTAANIVMIIIDVIYIIL